MSTLRLIRPLNSLIVATCVAAIALADDQPPRTDDAIQQAIAEQLRDDELLQGRAVKIEVSDGIVTLAGPVASLLEQERTARVASLVKGVRAVVNTTTIDSIRRPENELTTDVQIALARDPATELFQIEVKAADGTVTLTGSVDSYAEKLLASQVAKDVRGVHRLFNDLEVQTKHDRSDKEIDTEITRRLEADVWVDQRLIRVFVDDGHVRLRGVAGTLAERDAAEIDAWVAGVKSVDTSELQVDWQALDTARRQSKYAVRANYEIKEALGDAFRSDPRVNRFAIDIDIVGGWVVLSGEVHNLAAKRAAEQDALNTVGVTQVDNQLRVVIPKRRSDDELSDDLRSAFARDAHLANSEFDLSVKDRVAVMEGEVATPYVKQRAEQVASRVSGLVDIDNRLTVSDESRVVSDLQLKYGIKNRMYWSGYMDSREIAIRVDQGVVTLSGEVDSRAAFNMATRMAKEAGAREVRNRLLIREMVVGS